MSLQSRLILAALFVLCFFLGVTGYVLHRAFQHSIETALQERLQSHIYALLSVAETRDAQLNLPDELPVAGLALTDSGLYAEVSNEQLHAVWQSRSLLGQSINFNQQPGQGQWLFSRDETKAGIPLMVASFTIAWEDNNTVTPYTFHIAENLQRHMATLDEFKSQLWWGLGSAAVLLLIAQIVILRWGLLPLKNVARELDAIESGTQTRLAKSYPKELQILTSNLNRLLENAELRLRRYRESLGNLAHSLKTPVSVLHGILNKQQNLPEHDAAEEQLQRISQTVDYHLQRASTAGRNVLTRPVDVKQLIEKTARALSKVYVEKQVEVVLDLDEAVIFHGDEGDLMEVIGNLADNAFKWCQHKVIFSAKALSTANVQNSVEIIIEDDGPGIPQNISSYVTERGRRADTSVPGQGIGLSMVNEIVRLYGGELQITRASPSGARLRIMI